MRNKISVPLVLQDGNETLPVTIIIVKSYSLNQHNKCRSKPRYAGWKKCLLDSSSYWRLEMLLEMELLERTLETEPFLEWPDCEDCLEGVLDKERSDFSSHSSNLQHRACGFSYANEST